MLPSESDADRLVELAKDAGYSASEPERIPNIPEYRVRIDGNATEIKSFLGNHPKIKFSDRERQ